MNKKILQNQIQIGLQLQKDIDRIKDGPTCTNPNQEQVQKRGNNLGDLRYQMGLTIVKGCLEKKKRLAIKRFFENWKRNV